MKDWSKHREKLKRNSETLTSHLSPEAIRAQANRYRNSGEDYAVTARNFVVAAEVLEEIAAEKEQAAREAGKR